MKSALKFVALFVGNFLDHLCRFFNGWSRSFRYVSYILDREKKNLKRDMSSEINCPTLSMRSVADIQLQRRTIRFDTDEDLDAIEAEVEEFARRHRHNVIMRFLVASWYLVKSKTEIISYFAIILTMAANASVIALPLPILAFLWGTLCAPRPPKVFWITLITVY